MADCSTIYALLDVRTEQTQQSVAIVSPGRVSLTYGQLKEQVQSTVARLNSFGVGHNDRVAMVLRNGPEMAVAFLSVASGAVAAPLNPAYRAAEFDFYLSDLSAKALVIETGMESPAIEVARRRGIPVISLTPILDGPAGCFVLSGTQQTLDGPGGLAQPDDTALVLHTSGTTARPKMVPLTHRNLCISAGNIARVLRLTPTDRCLNVMPLFHIHGLVAATLSSLAAGASLVCTPGFYAPQFFEWLDHFRPTWYTAVPTMHQAILARVDENRGTIARSGLRFIRSSSSSLPPQVMADLERSFNVPVIEAYGMTEASHQIASNPLPPEARKPGSVGVPAGPEMAILADNGHGLLPPGAIGEVVIRGPSVTSGYANNPESNAEAFVDGWFRTGDQGYVDSEGYLYLTGRLKELINRGGQKISPREVDEVLLEHPAVAQAVTFAMPDKALGEDVAAAVVLRGSAVTEKDLRRFAALRLADFKVPRRIVMVDEIPKGPTGKIQRIGLAERLGLLTELVVADSSPGPITLPRTQVEEILAQLWREVLHIPVVGVDQRFLDLGGDSMLATQIVARVRRSFGIELSLLDFFDAPTIADQATAVEACLLQEIEDLPEDEARRLLGEATAEPPPHDRR